jgi:hypothetical protein
LRFQSGFSQRIAKEEDENSQLDVLKQGFGQGSPASNNVVIKEVRIAILGSTSNTLWGRGK